MQIQILTVCALILGAQAARAEGMLKSEPNRLGPMVEVYVDNGKCPGGQVMKVTGGGKVGGKRGGRFIERQHECVARP